MKTENRLNLTLKQTVIPLAIATIAFAATPVWALETTTAVTAASTGEFGLEPDTSLHSKERKEVEDLLSSIEAQWNSHNIDAVMGNYSEDYINNDGLDKKAVAELTKDFWKTYPDAKSSSKTKEIRIEGTYATVESRDIAVGTTAREMAGVNTKGDLNSISEGQLYLKKTGTVWKITGDRIDYEKVRVAFGIARDLDAVFSAPEQVKAGKQYSAKLELSLPQGLQAIGSIVASPLEFPQNPQPETMRERREFDGNVLERMRNANTENHNELLMATVLLANREKSAIGIAFLTRRLNVVPNQPEADKGGEKTASSESKSTVKAEAPANSK